MIPAAEAPVTVRNKLLDFWNSPEQSSTYHTLAENHSSESTFYCKVCGLIRQFWTTNCPGPSAALNPNNATTLREGGPPLSWVEKGHADFKGGQWWIVEEWAEGLDKYKQPPTFEYVKSPTIKGIRIGEILYLDSKTGKVSNTRTPGSKEVTVTSVNESLTGGQITVEVTSERRV